MKVVKEDTIVPKVMNESSSSNSNEVISAKSRLESVPTLLSMEDKEVITSHSSQHQQTISESMEQDKESVLSSSLEITDSRESMVATEHSVGWPSDGILRQALMSFSYHNPEEKTQKEKSNSKHEPEVGLPKLSDLHEISDDSEDMKHNEPEPAVSHIILSPSKSTSLLSGDLPLEHLPLSLSPGSFSGGSLPLMGPLPPVSEIPRPGSIPPLIHCTLASSVIGDNLPLSRTTDSFDNRSAVSISLLSDVLSTSNSSLGSPLKTLLPLTQPTYSTRIITSTSPTQYSTSYSLRETPVTLVYSSIPKLEPATTYLTQSLQKMTPLPPMSEMKSSRTSHLELLKHNQNSTKLRNILKSSKLNNDQSISIPTTSVLSITNGSGHNTSESMEDISMISSSSISVNVNTVKMDTSLASANNLAGSIAVATSASPMPTKFHSSHGSTLDLSSGILIPVSNISNNMTQGKLHDHHLHDVSQIITIPLTANAIYGHLPVSIPISSTLPFSMPIQVSSSMAPVQNSSMPITSIGNLTSTHSASTRLCLKNIPATTSGEVESSTSHEYSSIPVTSEMITIPPKAIVSPSCTMSSISSNDSTDTLPIASNIPSTSTNGVFTNSGSMESLTYAMQSPAEILSQLSKAGVLPTMSSSQVSSVLSALTSDNSIDLENDGAHHVEMLTQVMHLSNSPDKASTLTQTENLELDSTVELACVSSDLDNKVICTRNSADDSLMLQQVMSMLNQESQVGLPDKPDSPDDARLTTELPQSFDQHDGNGVGVCLRSPPASMKTPALPYRKIIEKQDILGMHLPSDIIKSSKCNLDLSKTSSSLTEVLSNLCEENVKCELMPMVFIKEEDSENILSLRARLSGGDKGNICENVSKRKNKSLELTGDKLLGFDNKKCKKTQRKSTVKNKKMNKHNGTHFMEQVACYKCKFCPFLSLEEQSVTMHFQQLHSSEMSGGKSETRHRLKCPVCPNVFFAKKSLKVHLSQDHQVGGVELQEIVNAVMKASTEVSSNQVKHDKKGRQTPKKDKKVFPNGPLEGIAELPKKCTISLEDVTTDGVPGDEQNKIRVRNLKNDPVLAEETSARSKAESNFVVTEMLTNNDNSLSSNGASADEGQEGSLVIDVDPLTQHKKATPSEDCKFEGQEDLAIESSFSRKRGRPKGSKNGIGQGSKRMPGDKSQDKEQGYRCDVGGCAVRMQSHDNIEYHRRCHSGKVFQCPECHHKLNNWSSVSSHLWRGHGIDMELYSCTQCSYKTNSFSKLTNLHIRIHGDERPFLCDICGKGFKNPKQMRNHKVIHTAKQNQKALKIGECDICGRTFNNPRMLRLHKDNVHDKLRPHLCNYCGYSASCRSTLKMHMRQHTGEKPFECEQCEYRTADHNSLRRHRMRHTGAKSYKCPHCEYACIQSSTYKAHIRSKHPGLESGLMFSCSLCSFRSVKKENYLAHIADHETEQLENGQMDSFVKQDPMSCSDDNNASPSKELERLPVIINISTSLPRSEAVTRSTTVLSPAQPVDRRRFFVNIPPNTVIQLVEDMDSVVEQSPVPVDESTKASRIETITLKLPLTPKFEAEEITGDIRN